jgi:acyl carrier protein
LEYLGRLDHQVKIRGFRIELGEIEGALLGHEGVRHCVVVAREEAAGDKRLVAYIEAEGEVGAGEWRAHLRQSLPEYMVPSAFVMLEALPLMPNGKIDRRALPWAGEGRREAQAEYLAPRTAAEEVVAGIWADVLRVKRVGVQDNFFELGGHSLLATQLISRVKSTFQVEQLPLRSIFESPTVEGVVAALAEVWGGNEIVEEYAQTLKELDQMSEAEVEAMLTEQGAER